MHGELAQVSASALAAMIRRGDVSPVEALDDALSRIDDRDPELNACTLVLRDSARAAAAEAEAAVLSREHLGPLHGVPVAIKDCIWVKDAPATFGSRAFAEFLAPEDAAVVRRLRAAGAVIVAKTTNPELAWAGYTSSDLHGVTRNPWNPELTPGGSSGGSAAAVAAGMVPLALGTDAGGSIRQPAAYTGLFGMKPTHGVVARTPGFDQSRSLSTAGPLARTLEDTRLCLDVIAGPDSSDNLSFPRPAAGQWPGFGITGLRIAWSTTVGSHTVDATNVTSLETAVARLTAAGLWLEAACPQPWDLEELGGPILFGELTAMLEGREHLLSPGARDLVSKSGTVSARAYNAAQSRRAQYTREWESFFGRYDAFLSPTVAVQPFAADPSGPVSIGGKLVDVHKGGAAYLSSQSDTSYGDLSHVANLTGCPALAVPIGIDQHGLPLSVQVMTRRFSDDLCLAVGEAISRILPAAPLPS